MVAARLPAPGDVDDVDDVVQETAARLWEVRWRLGREEMLGYGIVVARNLVSSKERTEEMARRHAPRLTEADATAGPSEGVLLTEEHAAVRAALDSLRAEDRDLLLEHEVAGTGLGKIAADHGTSSGTVAARLARARARLRVQHLLAYRRVTLPTPRCRPVLEALSLGDRSRQRALHGGEHLLVCPACADLAEPLLRRDRSLTVLAPFALLLLLPGKAWAWARANPLPATGTALGAGAAAVAIAVVAAPTEAPPAAAPRAEASPSGTAAVLSIGGVPILPTSGVGSLGRYAGRTATATGAPVHAVTADEGFWIGSAPGRRVWVQLTGPGESPQTIRPGARVTFTGRISAAGGRLPAGMDPDDAAEVRRAGGYLLVSPAALTVR